MKLVSWYNSWWRWRGNEPPALYVYSNYLQIVTIPNLLIPKCRILTEIQWRRPWKSRNQRPVFPIVNVAMYWARLLPSSLNKKSSHPSLLCRAHLLTVRLRISPGKFRAALLPLSRENRGKMLICAFSDSRANTPPVSTRENMASGLGMRTQPWCVTSTWRARPLSRLYTRARKKESVEKIQIRCHFYRLYLPIPSLFVEFYAAEVYSYACWCSPVEISLLFLFKLRFIEWPVGCSTGHKWMAIEPFVRSFWPTLDSKGLYLGVLALRKPRRLRCLQRYHSLPLYYYIVEK